MSSPSQPSPPPPTRPARDGASTAALALVPLLALAALAGVPLLLWLSSFGQDPLPALPLAAVIYFGALFAAPLHGLLRRNGGGAAAWTLLLGAAAATAGGGALPLLLGAPLPAGALAAPAAALGLAALLRFALPARRGAMFAAMAVYTACTLLANYTFDAFIPLAELAGFAFPLNVGTLFFGITFTQRDRVHRFGRRAVYAMIAVAAALNVVTALSLGTPLRYVAVGFLAIVVSEAADTEIYGRLLRRGWWTRVASSNAVSAPLDSLIFTVLAFAGEPFASVRWMTEVIVTDVLVKYGSGLLAAIGAAPRAEGAPPRVGAPEPGGGAARGS